VLESWVLRGDMFSMSKTPSVRSFSDAALENSDQDCFRRAPFAKAIAQTLSSLPDKTSIAIGIYGPWGDGKTTVLSFIKEAIREDAHMIAMDFNPWRFGEEDELLRSFFDSLVGKVGQSLTDAKDFVNKWKDVFIAVPYVGTAAEKLAAKLTARKLEEFKTKTEELLETAGKRIVVLMDDIDRLETEEIQAVFRLIKLTASINYVAYVLAFDDEVVAAALQEKYGAVSQSGQGFLEKIIQVPLHLPKIPTAVLRRFCCKCVEESLKAAGVKLADEEQKLFCSHLTLIAPQIHTPRQCKRYANGVAFALGILREEVNPVDLLLIEALRIFHPRLYKIIRSYREFFVSGEQFDFSIDSAQFEAEVMSDAWKGQTTQEQEALRKLLVHLFPDFGKSALQRQKIGLYDGFADRQRVASRHYFDRFFTYSIPPDQIQDKDVAQLLNKISERPIKRIAAQIQSMIDHAGSSRAFIERISLRRELLGPFQSPNLARGIAAVSENFPCLYEGSGMVLHFSDAVHLVRQLLLNTHTQLGERRRVMEDVVRDGVSLPFAYACLFAASETRPPDQAPWWEIYGNLSASHARHEPPITKDEYEQLAPIVAKRILSYFDKPDAYGIGQREPSKFLVDYWPASVPKDDLRKRLEKNVKANPIRAVGIISWHLRDPLEFGSIAKERYANITGLVAGPIIHKALEQQYGDALRSQGSPDPGLRCAQAFAYLYEKYGQSANSQS
jgi:hypothetical protein